MRRELDSRCSGVGGEGGDGRVSLGGGNGEEGFVCPLGRKRGERKVLGRGPKGERIEVIGSDGVEGEGNDCE